MTEELSQDLQRRLEGVTQLADAETMSRAFDEHWSADDLRKVCRSRQDIPKGSITVRQGGHKRNTTKPLLIPLLVSSLQAHPLALLRPLKTATAAEPAKKKTKTSNEPVRQEIKKRKESMPTRVMLALLRLPLWSDLIQYDIEAFYALFPSFAMNADGSSRDGIAAMAAQMKTPSLLTALVESLSKLDDGQGKDTTLVSDALRQAVLAWKAVDASIREAEIENLDGQGVARFLGFRSLARFGVMQQVDSDKVEPGKDYLTFGKTAKTLYELTEGPSPVVEKYLALDFGDVASMGAFPAFQAILFELRSKLPSSQLMGGTYVSPFTSRQCMIPHAYCHGYSSFAPPPILSTAPLIHRPADSLPSIFRMGPGGSV